MRVRLSRHFQLRKFTGPLRSAESKFNNTHDHGRHSKDHRRWGLTLLFPGEQACKDKVSFLCGGARHRDQTYDDLVSEDHAQDPLQADPADPEPTER